VSRRWLIAQTEPAVVEPLARALRLPPALATVLVNRGYRDSRSAQRFLRPQLRQLADPFQMPAMSAAVERIQQALATKQRVVLYGDYDVDGITSCALLTRLLRAVGGNVANFLPHRLTEGYGLSADGVARCLRECSPQLLIAVDCGTSSLREVAELKSHGVDTIILDHHEPPSELPECVALVNPKVGGTSVAPMSHEEKDNLETGPTALASVGVAFKLAHALLKSNRHWAVDLREHLDLVALGTVADVVPLSGENRILVKAGLERLSTTNKVGLRALMEITKVPTDLLPYHIGFRLAPRLNAAGRLADATAALELLLTEDTARAAELAKQLHEHNDQRQRIEEKIVAQALAQAREQGDARVLVLANPDWHIGVIGIVASRVAQEFYRPSVVIGAGGKGSCRSIPGFSMVAALAECAPLLERFGGHEMAAGLSVAQANIPRLARALNEIGARTLSEETLTPLLAIDATVRLVELDAEFFQALEWFEPCGTDNPTPVFAVRNVTVRGVPRMVSGKHLKFSVTDGERTAEAIWFGAGEVVLPKEAMDVAFTAALDEFRGEPTVQLRVRDARPSRPTGNENRG